jgi:hypothetical protein
VRFDALTIRYTAFGSNRKNLDAPEQPSLSVFAARRYG